MQRLLLKVLIMITTLTSLIACSNSNQLLNPDKPITINLWHYYNGIIKEEFDSLVSEFNETIGTDEGIIVETQSYGEITQLETALFAAANASIGSSPMPDVFAAYSDHVYQLSQIINLVPLDNYFSEAELATYREEFLTEGQFLNDGKSYILPIAKSTENLFVNKTDWEIFAKKHNFSNDVLKTWESIYNVAEKYYEETGKSFFSYDSNANFMRVFSKQLGSDFFSINDDGNAEVVLTEVDAKLIWDQFYIPHINGYYKKVGRFSTDDAKTGAVIAFIASTASAGYFPQEVTTNNKNTYKIEPLVLPYPYIEANDRYVIQQGAGMSITESDEAREYGAAIFLKWFTEMDQNMQFSIKSGYLPVKNEIYKNDRLLIFLDEDEDEMASQAIIDSFITTNQMFKDYTLYSSKPFNNSYKTREIIGTHLYNKVLNDLDIQTVRIENGENRSEILDEMASDEQFHKWFASFKKEIDYILE